MDYDAIVIGSGAAGEAAATLGAELSGRVAVVESDLVGGHCSFWACMPSKALLNSAMQRAYGADYPWERAAERRDWMINRQGIDYPDDSGHVAGLEKAGAEVIRGTARIVARGRAEVRSNGGVRTLEGRNIIVATGSEAAVPSITGLREAGFWTNREASTVRDLPSSIVVLGGGVVGVELAQVYARFGVTTVLVEGSERILARDHPRSSQVVADQLRYEGVDIRTGVTATAVRVGGPGRIVELSDGSEVEGAELLVAVGRRLHDLRALGLEDVGASLTERGLPRPDDQMRVAEGIYVAGDAAGGLQFTHLADYEGRVAIRAALGQECVADLRSVPKATFTDPETGAVGMTIEEAWNHGIDALEVWQDFSVTARGYTLEPMRTSDRAILEGAPGHVTVIVDREKKTLIGAFAACPGAGELIHEAALAIRADVPLWVLADTIHAFPTAARVFGNTVADAANQLGLRWHPRRDIGRRD
jgi:pyruvate/2-oxoglutarate dehydrogenase complex dihydrolipoamide dehydrogenase (E3) component